MIYRAIGITSGGEPAGLDIAFIEFSAVAGNWQYEIMVAEKIMYTAEWEQQLQQAASLSVLNFQLLNADYGTFTGQLVNNFIDKHSLQHKVQLLVFDGYTVFDLPGKKLTVQTGSGAAIAAVTGLAVITDLRTLDCFLGGNSHNAFSKAEMLLFPGRDAGENPTVIPFEKAVVTALVGILRWREEATTLISATGASRPSIGGAVWLGNEA